MNYWGRKYWPGRYWSLYWGGVVVATPAPSPIVGGGVGWLRLRIEGHADLTAPAAELHAVGTVRVRGRVAVVAPMAQLAASGKVRLVAVASLEPASARLETFGAIANRHGDWTIAVEADEEEDVFIVTTGG